MSAEEEVFQSLLAGDLDRLQMLLSEQPSLAQARNADDISLVMLARYRGRMDALRVILAADPPLDVFEAAAIGDDRRLSDLLATEPDRANAFAADGFPVLGLAVFFGHVECARLLLEHGADVNATARNAMAVQPLHSAVAANDVASTRLLLERGADVTARQRDGFTPLHEAAQNGNLAIVDMLLARGASVADRLDDGRTPIDLARVHGQEAVLDRLVSRT